MHPISQIHFRIAALAVLAAGCVSLSACSDGGAEGGPGAGGPPPAAVGVARVEKRLITEWDEFDGRIEAVHTVEVRPRVGGYLTGVHFSEGGLVKEGDLLFSIDTREYVAAVDRAEANLTRATTREKLAQQELERSRRLLEAQAVSTEEIQQREGEMQQASADIASARAELTQARLNLEFAVIRAPIDGRVGEAMVRAGNLVSPGTTLLTTLVSVDPVFVVFEGDENIYLKYQEQARSGDRPSSRTTRNPVQVGLVNEEGYPHLGEMDFVDNQLNPATGTIRGRALLPNPDGVFTPGLFARVRLLGSNEYEALLIHDMAVLTDQDRKYVYVVGPNNEALRKNVTLGKKSEGLRIVLAGLEETDEVVVNGVRKIFFPGAPLAPEQVSMDAPLQAGP
ncbi:MAG: efflux RND transporter periplasmic adaptor subunit [Pseudomonadota bacterium]